MESTVEKEITVHRVLESYNTQQAKSKTSSTFSGFIVLKQTKQTNKNTTQPPKKKPKHKKNQPTRKQTKKPKHKTPFDDFLAG